jgi:hypothetical protein
MSRHGTENITINEEELYEELVESRGIPKIKHYLTPRWPKLTASVRRKFVRLQHTWKLGDRYYKLANTYYGDSKLWWIIAWYNEKPTEGHVKSGMTLYIPTPIEDVLAYFNTFSK